MAKNNGKYAIQLMDLLPVLVGFVFLCASYTTHAQFDKSQYNNSNFPSDSLESLLQKGIDLMFNAEYSEAHDVFHFIASKAENCDSVRIQILALNNLGNLFYFLNESDSALSYYLYAQEIAKQKEVNSVLNTIYNNIGIIYASQGQTEEAREVLEDALALSILEKDTATMAKNYANLATQNIYNGNAILAKDQFLRATKYFKALNDSTGLFAAYKGLAENAILDRNYALSLAYLDTSESYMRTQEEGINFTKILVSRAFAYNQLGEQEKSFMLSSAAYENAMSNNQLNLASEILVDISAAYAQNNDYKNALIYSQKSLVIKDSLIQLEKKDWIQQNKARFQFALKSKEFEVLEKENEIRKTYVRVIIISLAIIILLLIVILRMRYKASKLKEVQFEMEQKLSKEKISIVQSQNQELQDKIETVNYELVSKTLLLENKNQIIHSIEGLMKEAANSDTEGTNTHIIQLKQQLLRNTHADQNWEDFKLYFERVHTDFFQNLHIAHPKLTSGDLRLSAFVLLQLSSKEISQILNITPESVRKRKQRLKEKLGLQKGSDLLQHLYPYAVH